MRNRLALWIGAALLAWSAGCGATHVPSSCLNGTFLQLYDGHARHPPAYWQNLFGYLRQLRIHTIVLQWSVIDDTALYPSEHFKPAERPLLEVVLEYAEAAGMKVMVGLAHDPKFWKEIEKPDKRAHLEAHAQRVIKAAREIAPLVRRYGAFAGWYLSEEIDNIHWQDEASRAALVAYLRATTGELARLAPGHDIAISTFSNGKSDAALFALWWRGVLAQAPLLSTLYLQDGVGVQHLSLAKVGELYLALGEVTRQQRRSLVPVIEVFAQTGGQPIDAGVFQARPADMTRIRRQIALASSHAGAWIAFGVPEYLTPAGGKQARAAYQRVLRAQRRGPRCP